MSVKWYERLWPREGWGVLLLTLALVIVVSAAVADAGWTSGLNVITGVSLGAFVIGFVIGYATRDELRSCPTTLRPQIRKLFRKKMTKGRRVSASP